jgi:acetyl esterase/lipase
MAVIASATADIRAQKGNEGEIERQRDVIYGRKFGTALTMDVMKPAEPRGLGVIFVVSGGWYSAHNAINQGFARPLLDRGYTVFAVVHGSQPKFTIPEIVEDLHQAVRFVRYNAEDFGIDPAHLGITGLSAGGHLSLMQGTAGKPPAEEPRNGDPVAGASSRVQAVACFFPPTDFLNYGREGNVALGRGVLRNFRAPFDFHEFDRQANSFVPVTDEARLLEIGKEISPVYHVTADDPPTLIIHGDADELVPIQQAERIVERLEEAGVPNQLVVKDGAGHGWPNIQADLELCADWFDKHLANKASDKPEEEKEAAAGAQDK